MAQLTALVLNADNRGKWGEGVISGTPNPGIFLEIVPATNPVSGRFTWRARSAANGAFGPVVELVNNWETGQGVTTAYTSGDRCKMYWPLPGDELNAVVAESSGTGTLGENLIGDRLSINNSGQLMAGTSNQQCFYLLDRTGLDTYTTALKWVQFLGSNA